MPSGKIIPIPRHLPAVASHAGRVPAGEALSPAHAVSVLAALAQPTRLEIFRSVLKREPDGIPAGAIAQMVAAPHNTVSTHLGILVRAGLLRSAREGRSIIYRADMEGMRSLLAFLINDCCGGHPELCNLVGTSIAQTGCGCEPQKQNAQRSNQS